MSVEGNVLKVRDDRRPVYFTGDVEAGEFKVDGDNSASWAAGGEFDFHDLRKRIEPWLTSLFQSEHLTLLVGSGLTHAVHKMVTGEPAAGMDKIELLTYDPEITEAATQTAKRIGRAKANFEDQLRVALEGDC